MTTSLIILILFAVAFFVLMQLYKRENVKDKAEETTEAFSEVLEDVQKNINK